MKVLLAPDTSDHQNWGCRVMGAGFRAALPRNGARVVWRIPSAWFYRNDPELGRLSSMADIRAIGERVARGQVLRELSISLRACDLVYMNAENFIRRGTTKGRRLLLLAYLAKVVFGKPCVISNASLEMEEPELVEMVTEILPLLDEVHLREEESVEHAGVLFEPPRWRRIPDIAWAYPAAPLEQWAELGSRAGHFSAWPDMADGFDPRRPYVTVCASSAYSLPRGSGVDMVPAFTRLCQRLHAEVGPVLLAAPDESDLVLLRKVQAAASLPLLGTHMPVQQAVDVIGNARVHVGGRWHLGIFAATGGTPQVALGANSHKMQGLARQLGHAEEVFDPFALGEHIDEIVDLARQHVAAGQPLRDRIQAQARELAEQVPANMEFVRRFPGR